MERVFITGGAGFIGRWAAQQALARGLAVAVYDNLCAGSAEHVADFRGQLSFFEADILDEQALSEAMAAFRPDTVIHLAAHHFIPYCNAHPIETLRVNADGTYAVLAAAAANRAKTAVVASSGVVYPGVPDVLDEDLPVAPPDIYGLSKWMAEQVTAYVARTTGMACVAARLFNAYGPYETNPHLVPHIIDELRKGPTIHLGNIHTKRDYVYVEDTARLLLACAEAAPEGYTVVNVGTGKEYSAAEIVETLGELLGTSLQIEVDQERVRAVDKPHQRAGTARLRALTGTGAAFELQEGLARLLRYENLLTGEVASAA